MTTEPTNPATEYPPCVEHGVWTPVPVAPPPGALLLKLKDVDAGESSSIKKRGVLSFHLTGCTGHFTNDVPETAVARAMAKQVEDPRCYGGYKNAAPASFFFHLGDIVYKDEDQTDAERADQQKLYNEHFYTAYAGYPRNIFAIAGNHDGKDSKHPEKSAIRHFLKNFCDSQRTISPDNQTSGRATMAQPYPYWLLRTPLAYLIGLYTNDINGGQLDDPEGRKRPQYDWLVDTLKAIRKEADERAVFIAVHYPPYSAAVNFLQRGDPNLGPTPRPQQLQPLGMILQQAYQESKQYPDAVFSAHAHHYQRITYTHAGGRQIPYVIAGSGGHAPVEGLAHDCEGNVGTPPVPPADIVCPPGLTFPAGDSARLVAYNDQDFGFLRLTLDSKKKILVGEFFAAYSEVHNSDGLPALFDSFTVDLRAHRLV
jgi:hypothetical protein